MDMQVRAMGCGLLDSLYDAINVFNENKSSSNIPDTTTELMEVEPPPSKRKSKCVAKGDNDTNVGSKDPGCSTLSLSLPLWHTHTTLFVLFDLHTEFCAMPWN